MAAQHIWRGAGREAGRTPRRPAVGAKASWPEIAVAGPLPPAQALAADPPPANVAATGLQFDEAELARAVAAVAAETRRGEQQAATQREAARLAVALETIAARLAAADAAVEWRTRQFREAATTLAALATETVGRGNGKLAARLAEALVTDCLSRLDPTLTLTVEVAPELAEPLAATLAAAPGLRQRPGRLAVEPVATLAPGEARLVWADGDADWSSRRLHDAAAELIRRLTSPPGSRGGPKATTDRQPEAIQGADPR